MEKKKNYLEVYLQNFRHFSPFVCSVGTPLGTDTESKLKQIVIHLAENGGNPTLRHADTSGVGSHSQWCVQLIAASRVRGYPQSGSAFRDRNGKMGQGLLSIG